MNPVILMYHRVAEPHTDPWDLAVTPRHFAEQLSVLKRRRDVLPISEFVRRWVGQDLPVGAVAITFDDGYVDNLEQALPRLEAAELPAAIFLAAGYLDSRHPYWWDELVDLILVQISEHTLELELPEPTKVDLGPLDALVQSRRWRAGMAPKTTRQHALLSLWQTLQDMDFAKRQHIMTSIRLAAPQVSATVGRPMTKEEAQRLSSSPLITAGAHSVTHPDFTKLSPAQMIEELLESRRVCEEIADTPVVGFAFPYGLENVAARSAVKTKGFSYALGIERRAIDRHADQFALPRVQVPDMDGDLFERVLDELS